MTAAERIDSYIRHLASPGSGAGYLWPRWIWLRALGLIFLSAFYSLALQIHGLIGSRGILPQGRYLAEARQAVPGLARFWDFPSLFWLNASDGALTLVLAAGLLCSILITLNVWPRVTIGLATALFLSCITTLQVFSSYQSDGMLLEAGLLSIFFAPAGARPGLGATHPPSRVSLFMLRWEWFRIYFESGIVKLASGDPHWRNLTAMDDYYQNGPLPAWPGWYIQHLPHWYHAATVIITLGIELFVVWAVFLPRPFRLLCAAGVTALQTGIIATANYAFLNYLVLMLGVLLLDDGVFERTARWLRSGGRCRRAFSVFRSLWLRRRPGAQSNGFTENAQRSTHNDSDRTERPPAPLAWRTRASTLFLCVLFYTSISAFAAPSDSILRSPARWLDPFRIANAYGLFATMTPARYEIEFQGSADGGKTWIAYPFRYKPQNPMERPGVYAPYHPRFEWNLWFASLAPWQDSPWVLNTQARLIEGSPSVLRLFRDDPFKGHPPPRVRTVLWQYWFTDWRTHEETGAWWRRKQLGLFAGELSRGADGQLTLTAPQ